MWRYLIYLLLLSSSLVAGESSSALSVFESNSPQEEAAQPPDPMHLDPSWWQYYAPIGVDYAENVQKSFVELQKLWSSLNEDEQPLAESFIKRFFINLKALAQAHTTTVENPLLEPLRYQYTLQQQFEMLTAQYKDKMLLKSGEKELRQLNDRANAVRKHSDTLFANYLSNNKENTDKLLAGLEIMSLRAALAVTEENIRIATQRNEALLKKITHQESLLKHVKEHLNLADEDLQILDESIAQAEMQLTRAKDRTLAAEMHALGSFADSPLERGRAFLLAQQSLLAALQEAAAAVDLLLLQAKRYLVALAQGDEEATDDVNPHEQMAEWRMGLREAKDLLQNAQQQTEQESERLLLPQARSENSADADSFQLEELFHARSDAVASSMQTIRQLRNNIDNGAAVLDRLQGLVSKKEHGIISYWITIWEWVNDCCDPIMGWIYTPLLKVGGVPITALGLLRVCIILGLAYVLSAFLQQLIKRFADNNQRHITPSSVFLINKLVHYLILLLGCAIALASIGMNFSNVFILLGALSVGIGFGLQTIANNFCSGLIVLFSRTLKLGDYVELESGEYGIVTAINVQNTVIQTNDGIDLIVPNSEIISSKLRNWTLKDNLRRLHIPFEVAYGTDKELVSKAVIEAAKKVPCTVLNSPYHHDPQVWLVGFGDSALQFELVVWVNVYGFGHRGSVRSSFTWEIDSALREYNIEVPFPQREVRILNLDETASKKALETAAKASLN